MKAMTDREKVEDLFTELGIGYKIKRDEDSGKPSVKIREGYDKVGGYNRFAAWFDFDADGAFEGVTIDE